MEITIEEVFEAYYACRKTKRYSKGALNFELNYEENLIRLYEDLKNRKWQPGKSNCFIVTKPVRREIFAAPFRDRIVHHILIGRLNTKDSGKTADRSGMVWYTISMADLKVEGYRYEYCK